MVICISRGHCFSNQMKNDATIAGAKLSPPVFVTAWETLNSSLPTIILWMTAFYTGLQIYVLISKVIQARKDRKEELKNKENNNESD